MRGLGVGVEVFATARRTGAAAGGAVDSTEVAKAREEEAKAEGCDGVRAGQCWSLRPSCESAHPQDPSCCCQERHGVVVVSKGGLGGFWDEEALSIFRSFGLLAGVSFQFILQGEESTMPRGTEEAAAAPKPPSSSTSSKPRPPSTR